MNIDELRTVQSRERSTSELQELRDSFYEDVAEYVAELRDERDRVATDRDDPYDDEVIRLTDQVRTAEQVAESIYERRVGKLVKHASFTANGMGNDPAGLTTEERVLYEDIVDRIQENKQTVLEVIANGDTPTTDDAGRPPTEHRHDSGDDTSQSRSPSGDDDTSPPETTGTETDSETADDTTVRETVRITEDVGEIYGVDDRVYTLEADDVVSLPEENASPLLARDAAESLE